MAIPTRPIHFMTMNTQELNRFIQAVQYLDILSSLGKSGKPRDNCLNQLRARIEQLVVLRATEKPVITEDFAAATLLQFTSLAQPIIAKLTPAQLVKATIGGLSPVFKVDGKVFPRSSLLKLMEPMAKLADTPASFDRVNQELLKSKTGANRGQMLHAFSSLSRNTGWPTTFLSLGATVDDALSWAAAIQRAKGSKTGCSEAYVSTCLSMLVEDVLSTSTKVSPSEAGRKKKPETAPKAVEATVGQVVVKFSLEALLTQPGSAELIRRIQRDSPPGDESLKRVLKAAATGLPVQEGAKTLDTAVADVLQTVIEKLTALETEIQAKQEAMRIAKEQADKEKLLRELKKLGPALDLLKRNPELLKEL